MSKIIDTIGLPSPLVRAITNDPYDKGDCDYSTTSLIKPARIVALEKQYGDQLTEEAADRIWSLIGQIGHTILERAGGNDIVERRLFATFEGTRISGQVDIIEGTHLQDYKVTSVFSAKDGLKSDWEQQLNVNRWLCRQNDIPIDRASIVAIFRDWSVSKARRERDFPQQQVQILESPIWPDEKVEQFIRDRIAAHRAAETTLPDCTAAERWARPTTWAIKKRGGSRAITGGVHLTELEAERHLATLSTVTHEIEVRRGISVRCADYCVAAPKCSQWAKLQQEEQGE